MSKRIKNISIPKVANVDLKALASTMRSVEPRLREIYTTPKAEGKLAKDVNRLIGRDIVKTADCGGDLVAVIVIVDVAAPAPG